jgi:hypothetical protein
MLAQLARLTASGELLGFGVGAVALLLSLVALKEIWTAIFNRQMLVIVVLLILVIAVSYGMDATGRAAWPKKPIAAAALQTKAP